MGSEDFDGSRDRWEPSALTVVISDGSRRDGHEARPGLGARCEKHEPASRSEKHRPSLEYEDYDGSRDREEEGEKRVVRVGDDFEDIVSVGSRIVSVVSRPRSRAPLGRLSIGAPPTRTHLS